MGVVLSLSCGGPQGREATPQMLAEKVARDLACPSAEIVQTHSPSLEGYQMTKQAPQTAHSCAIGCGRRVAYEKRCAAVGHESPSISLMGSTRRTIYQCDWVVLDPPRCPASYCASRDPQFAGKWLDLRSYCMCESMCRAP